MSFERVKKRQLTAISHTQPAVTVGFDKKKDDMEILPCLFLEGVAVENSHLVVQLPLYLYMIMSLGRLYHYPIN
jgi:hypothetical protein